MATSLETPPKISSKYNHVIKYVLVNITRKPKKGAESDRLYRNTDRILNNREPEVLSINKVAKLCLTNMIVFSDYRGKRKKDNFIQSSIFAIDIDEGLTAESFQTLIKQTEKMNAAFIYETLSSSPEKPRCRVVFQLDKPVTNVMDMELIIKSTAQRIEKAVHGVETDKACYNPTHKFLNGKTLIEIDYNNVLNTDEQLQLIQQYKAEKLRVKLKRKESVYESNTTISELKEMAECIGIVADRNEWINLGISLKHHANEGHITDEQGYEIFSIISDDDEDYNEHTWNSFKPSGDMTIASFCNMAYKNGYERTYSHVLSKVDSSNKFIIETIQYNKYLSELEIIDSLVGCNEKVLVQATTGAGKTYAFISSCKKQNEGIYIFATPTRSLTQQVATEYGVTCIIGSDKTHKSKVKGIVQKALNNNEHIFVATYDMVKPLYEQLLHANKTADIHIIIDEYHKVVYDYNFRDNAINKMLNVASKCKTLIGLSATIEEIDKNDFDRMITFAPSTPKKDFEQFVVYSYSGGSRSYLIDLVALIKAKVTISNRKMIIFLQQKEEISKAAKLLKKENIKVGVVTSESKGNDIYNRIVTTGTIPEQVDVILSTTVIADGVSIKNETAEYEVIVVLNGQSKLHNISVIKQISNRLRNTYRTFSLFMRGKEDKSKRKQSFNVEGCYKYLQNESEETLEHINVLLYSDLEKFYQGKLESEYGIIRKQSIDGFFLGELAIDYRLLRKQAFEQKSAYYRRNQNKLIKDLTEVFKISTVNVFSVAEAIERTYINDDIQGISEGLEQLKEAKKLDNEGKKLNFINHYSEATHRQVVFGDKEVLSVLKNSMVDYQYSALKKVAPLLPFEDTKKVVQMVNKKAQTNEFLKDIKVVVEHRDYKEGLHKNKTALVLDHMENTLVGKEFTKEELDLQFKVISTKEKVRFNTVKSLMSHFETEKTRTKISRTTLVKGKLTADSISRKYGITNEVTNTAINLYSQAMGSNLPF